MIRTRSLWCALALAGSLLTITAADTSLPPDRLCVVSYNLRFASSNQPNAWPDRRPVMRELLQKLQPDVMGTQEGVYYQLKEIERDLPGYAWIGLGRDGGSRGEFMGIFFRTERLDPLAFDHYWLSDTPEVMGSSTWGNANKRMVTWVRFLDKRTKKEFYLVDTHLDHKSQPAREKGAQLIRERMAALDPALPLFLLGDFNATETNPAYKILTCDGFLKDTWYTAKERRGEGLNTFNGFDKIEKKNIRIDWILARGPMQVFAEEIVTFSKNGQFPSDHCPLAAWVKLE